MNPNDTVPCPRCGNPMYEDSPRCPACGQYLTDADLNQGFPTWVVWVIVLTVASLAIPYVWPILIGR